MKSWWSDRIHSRLWYFHLPAGSGRWLKMGLDWDVGDRGMLSLVWDDLRGERLTAQAGGDAIEHSALDIKWFL